MWKWYGIKPFSREGENCIVTEDEGTVEVTSSVFDSDYQPLGIFKLQFLVKICFDGIVGDNLNYVNVSIVLRHNGVDIDELNALSGSVDLGEYVLTQVTPNATDNNYMEIAGRLNKF
jgi:Ethanolamine utilization protein EutJ (predicted chaperonin)